MWLSVAAEVLAAARRAAVRLTAAHGKACARTNDTSCLPEPSVTNVRPMLESCDNRVRREKRTVPLFSATHNGVVRVWRPGPPDRLLSNKLLQAGVMCTLQMDRVSVQMAMG